MKKIEEMDDREISLATKIFDLEYREPDITDDEKIIRNNMYNSFLDEIKEARDIIRTVEGFNKYNINDKIAFSLELLRQLAIDSYSIDNTNYVDIYEIINIKNNKQNKKIL